MLNEYYSGWCDENITELSSYLIEKQIYSGQRQTDGITTFIATNYYYCTPKTIKQWTYNTYTVLLYI